MWLSVFRKISDVLSRERSGWENDCGGFSRGTSACDSSSGDRGSSRLVHELLAVACRIGCRRPVGRPE